MERILMTEQGKKFHVKDTSKDFHTQHGYVKKKDLKKKKGIVKTNTGKKFFIFEPSFIDSYKKMKRKPQIITLKDIATIITETGINPKTKVVDAGTGSGALACFLAKIAKNVTSYDVREDFIKVAEKNKQTLGLKNLKIKKGDIYKGIKEKNIDVLTLDLPEPWEAIETANKSLKQGGILVSYSPTITQSADFVNEIIKNENFIHLKTIENIQRKWEINQRKVRPRTKIINHTGFLSFARKVGGK